MSRNSDYPVELHFESELSDIIESCDTMYNPPSPNPTYPPTPRTSPTETCDPTLLPQLHTPPLFSRKSTVSICDDYTSVMCGCEGHFFWEFIPTTNLNFFRGTAPDTVDRCMSSIYVYRSFREAFWDAYSQCIEHCNTYTTPCVEDFALAVYQLHQSDTCPRHYTRYTLGSLKSFMQYNEKLRENPIVGAFCRCKREISPADIPYNVCFTCLQSTLELKALSLVGVLENFSYEVNFKQGFLAALQQGVRNTPVYFLAQALFETTISNNVKVSMGYHNTWKSRGNRSMSWKRLSKLTLNKSFCVLCNKPGNGFAPFACSTCTKY